MQVRSPARAAESLSPEEWTIRLESLPRVSGAAPLINLDGTDESWIASGAAVPQELPQALRDQVLFSQDTRAFRMRYEAGGEPRLAFGIHLQSTDQASEISYFEVVPLQEVADNLRNLGLILIVTGAATTAAGAILGYWVSGRVLRPLSDISTAAGAIAGGRMETRLESQDDPDLAPLVSSFNNMAEALQERIERDARFASDVSHELRSPLMTLRASIDVVNNRREELSERSQEALQLLVDDVDRFEQLVGDLLEISRSDAGASDTDFSRINLFELVRAAVRRSQHVDVPVHVDDWVQEATVVGDKRRLAQVVTNLLNNAAKYGGGATLVRVTGDRQVVRIEVEDEGPGVPDSEKQLVFERFARGSAAGARGSGGGAGLGLALVAEHLRLHDGEVWVEDRADVPSGARFVVVLPRADR